LRSVRASVVRHAAGRTGASLRTASSRPEHAMMAAQETACTSRHELHLGKRLQRRNLQRLRRARALQEESIQFAVTNTTTGGGGGERLDMFVVRARASVEAWTWASRSRGVCVTHIRLGCHAATRRACSRHGWTCLKLPSSSSSFLFLSLLSFFLGHNMGNFPEMELKLYTHFTTCTQVGAL